ncbi:hypothetical protein AVEN_140073-1 [Araneus ventricosus]|uniref:Transposable element P transposase-like RNase H domain-containing protein n=1 Tax=Araneus ventricosus TaxID=182803 RepID=A0A4Y2KAX6_ARAVE|nr:hypothetical protein AVEN_140073-1 [Araneus ventricosus]
MSESETLCVLSIDEMAIKPGYTYAEDLDCVDGFTTFKQDYKEKPPYATSALVFMARGVVKNWKQVQKNQGLFKEMNVTTENPFFVHKTKKIYAMYDPPHLLKSVRNNLKNHGIYYEDTSIGDTPRTAFANWKHIEELYEMDSKDEFSA